MKDAGDVMEILEAYDLVGSFRAAAEIADCDHHTVKLHVERRAAGLTPGDGIRRWIRRASRCRADAW